MWAGYFTVGGNEVGNSARALGYTRTSDCPITWLRDVECGGLIDALGAGGYVYDSITMAPWYDPDNGDLTSRFLGLYVVSMEGLSDSTRSANVTEKIVDGAQVSGYRHSSREVRVRAMLSAKGNDALEAGMTWLRNVLEPDACGVHGADCGASDFQFFVDCPPTRGVVPAYGAFTERRRNLAANPNFETNLSSWTVEGGAAFTRITSGQISGTASGRLAGPTGDIYTTAVAAPGDTFTFSLDYQSSGTVTGTPRIALSNLGGTVATVTQSLPLAQVAPGRYSVTTAVMPTGTTAVVAAIYAPTGGALFIDNVLLEKTTFGAQPYFDGSTVPVYDEYETIVGQYAWVGTANASASTYSTRNVTSSTPESDVAYQARLDDYWRILHTVTCVSGPLVQRTFNSSDNLHVGYLVEFTMLAAVPFVFSRPHEIAVPPTTPTVIEDAAFNLEPYPSAELTNSTLTVATNYSANPSVEVDATGWAATSAVVLAGNVTGARSTALSAQGAASFRTRFVATNSGTNGEILAENTSATFPTAAAGTRMSLNLWVTSLVFSGTANISVTEVLAMWRSGTTNLRQDTVGSVSGVSSGAMIAKSLAPPAGANNVILRARVFLASWTSGATVDLYADAAAVTVP